jgi:pilus assembly protein Flp/PilA
MKSIEEKRMTKFKMRWSATARQIARFRTDQSGATAVEYAMIAVGIAVVIVVAVTAIGSSVKGSFTSVSSGL